MKELPPRPKTPEEGPTEQQTQPRGRVWIKEESPDREYRPTENGLSTSRGSSVTGPTAVNVHGRLQNLYITRNVPVVQDRQDDDSTLVDMASFLKSTGPDTPSSSGEEYFDRPVKPCRPRSQYQARDPVVRGDSSDLINFFREGSPRLRRNGSTKIHGNGTPVRRATAPIFTPLHTGREEFEQKSPQPPKNPSMMTPIRSHSLSLPSPLGSHPPEPQIDAFQPSTPKWPLHSVISWLEKNSFSPEWQQTFRVLQIQGQDFVALGSGQSIRKMLSVIYPQVAREYSENGKTWDDEQGRAEGQRLRKLIRELPVADKYEDDEQGAKGMIAIRPAARPSIVATGRRRVITTPTEATAPTTSEAQARSGQDGPNDIPIQESEEEHSTPYSTPPQTTAGIGHTHSSSVDSKSSNVSDEWVRKWTLLSPAEIARGKVVAAI